MPNVSEVIDVNKSSACIICHYYGFTLQPTVMIVMIY